MLCEDFMHDSAMHIGKPPIDARMPIRQPFVIDSQQMQQRCVKVIAVTTPLDRLVA
jgi:hypothetical protein